MNNESEIKLVALDMDGTLTQHRTKLEEKNKLILQQICNKYKAVIIGAGTCRRIYEQLDHFNIDIIGNYGMQQSTVSKIDGKDVLVIIKNIIVNTDKKMIEDKINKIRKITGYTKFQGESVEFHESGAITFPLLGTKANINEKLKFDPDRKKRRGIYDIVKNEFSDFTVFIGGSSSFYIVPKDFNKYVALKEYANNLGIDSDNIIYFGDDYGKGGNDEHIYKSEIRFVKVDDYNKFQDYAKILL
ncbi:MAG: HAD family phosphatase [Clostridiales bacterium]|nr:HAD family phosphatase [Clostridiales bacterium]